MILFKALLEGTSFAVETLAGQSFEKVLPINVKDIKIIVEFREFQDMLEKIINLNI